MIRLFWFGVWFYADPAPGGCWLWIQADIQFSIILRNVGKVSGYLYIYGYLFPFLFSTQLKHFCPRLPFLLWMVPNLKAGVFLVDPDLDRNTIVHNVTQHNNPILRLSRWVWVPAGGHASVRTDARAVPRRLACWGGGGSRLPQRYEFLQRERRPGRGYWPHQAGLFSLSKLQNRW